MVHFILVTLGGHDLLTVALASVDKYAGDCNVDIVESQSDKGSWAHGDALDHWRRAQKVGVLDSDIVCVMDPDVVLLSEWWRREMEYQFSDARVGIWGAGAREDFGPRVHASMMCIRGQVFNDMEATFRPVFGGQWRDTGGAYCRMASVTGWKVVPHERGKDWRGYSCWRLSGGDAMWAHLGSGVTSDPKRMTRWQRVVKWSHVRRRRAFVRAAQTHLSSAS